MHGAVSTLSNPVIPSTIKILKLGIIIKTNQASIMFMLHTFPPTDLQTFGQKLCLPWVDTWSWSHVIHFWMFTAATESEEEVPSLLWGLDPIFSAFARLYIKDVQEMKESKQVPGELWDCYDMYNITGFNEKPSITVLWTDNPAPDKNFSLPSVSERSSEDR